MNLEDYLYYEITHPLKVIVFKDYDREGSEYPYTIDFDSGGMTMFSLIPLSKDNLVGVYEQLLTKFSDMALDDPVDFNRLLTSDETAAKPVFRVHWEGTRFIDDKVVRHAHPLTLPESFVLLRALHRFLCKNTAGIIE